LFQLFQPMGGVGARSAGKQVEAIKKARASLSPIHP
jgi:hypothetical protein